MPYLAVAVGGFVGACARYLLTTWAGTQHGLPFATLCINVGGSLFLSWFYLITMERMPIHPHLRLGLGTGLVGAFTTFSAFTAETWQLWQSGQWLVAVGYVALSFGLCLLGASVGYAIAAWQSRFRPWS